MFGCLRACLRGKFSPKPGKVSKQQEWETMVAWPHSIQHRWSICIIIYIYIVINDIWRVHHQSAGIFVCCLFPIHIWSWRVELILEGTAGTKGARGEWPWRWFCTSLELPGGYGDNPWCRWEKVTPWTKDHAVFVMEMNLSMWLMVVYIEVWNMICILAQAGPQMYASLDPKDRLPIWP